MFVKKPRKRQREAQEKAAQLTLEYFNDAQDIIQIARDDWKGLEKVLHETIRKKSDQFLTTNAYGDIFVVTEGSVSSGVRVDPAVRAIVVAKYKRDNFR